MSGTHGARSTELQAEGLHFARDGIEILAGVDLRLRAGERVALTGPSGSGKSTLVSLLAGLAAPDAGTVKLDGRTLSGRDAESRHRIRVVFQGYALVALLTAAENVELPLVAGGLTAPAAARRSRWALALTGLEDRSAHLVEELSGGQQQRLAVARALAARPDFLLADEPTTEQDTLHRERTVDAVLAAAEHGVGVLLATHDDEIAMRCDRWVHLEEGLLSAKGGPGDPG